MQSNSAISAFSTSDVRLALGLAFCGFAFPGFLFGAFWLRYTNGLPI